ncbi:MAG: hypothetical protein ABW252_03460 [Polyangiales bacterium]
MATLVVSSLAARARGDDAFARIGDPTDALALARVADDAGDLALRARLVADGDRAAAIVAARASVFAAAPELLVPALAALACGRDPELVPEAAAALTALTARLAPSALSDREALRADIADARAALVCPPTAPRPRLDVVVALETLAASLDTLLR